MDKQDYMIALLERIAFQTQGGNKAFEDYLETTVKLGFVGAGEVKPQPTVQQEFKHTKGSWRGRH